VVHFNTIKEAEDNKRTRDELVNTYEKQILDLETTLMDLQSRHQLTLESLSQLKQEFNEKIFNSVSKVMEITENQGQDMVDVLKNKAHFQKLGYLEADALRKGMEKHATETWAEYNQLKAENNQLKGQILGMGGKLEQLIKEKPFNPNEIHLIEENAEKKPETGVKS
jgi:uncharacterized protein YwqG